MGNLESIAKKIFKTFIPNSPIQLCETSKISKKTIFSKGRVWTLFRDSNSFFAYISLALLRIGFKLA